MISRLELFSRPDLTQELLEEQREADVEGDSLKTNMGKWNHL